MRWALVVLGIGFVAAKPIPQVLRNINSFTLGAQSVNPKIKTKVVWVNAWFDPPKESEGAQSLLNQGADVLFQNTDSAAVLQTAEKAGKFLPADPAAHWHTVQWLMFQMGGVGPMFGQLGFFHAFKGREIEDKRPRDRYVAESRRLLGVLDRQLEGRDWITGDYSIADIATTPWVNNLVNRYKAGDLVGADDFANVAAWVDRFLARPAVQRGLVVGAEN